jgi:hypothetical protein
LVRTASHSEAVRFSSGATATSPGLVYSCIALPSGTVWILSPSRGA